MNKAGSLLEKVNKLLNAYSSATRCSSSVKLCCLPALQAKQSENCRLAENYSNMYNSYKKAGLWIVLTLFIYAIFRWLMGLAMPTVALEFALGITTLIITGLLCGTWVSGIWFKARLRTQNTVFFILFLLILLGLLTIGLLVNRMIAHTEFVDFFFTVLSLFLLNVFVGAAISLMRNRIRTNFLRAQNALVHTKSELQVLQSQLSPHFLFNTLNNLYGLSITDHEKVPDLLLRLSALLRYSVYDAKELFVSLKDELDYLKNYIEFEKIRVGERLDLKVDFEHLQDEATKIAPMLLIVFVENAFKHSKNNQDEKVFIAMKLALSEDMVLFSVINSCDRSANGSGIENRHSGFGLKSVEKRLKLLYPNEHELQMRQSDREYVVHLELKKK